MFLHPNLLQDLFLTSLGGLFCTSQGVVKVDATGKVIFELRKPNLVSYEDSLVIHGRIQSAFGGVCKVYRDIETVSGRGLLVVNNDDAIFIMRELHDYALGSKGNHMRRIMKWWDAGKPHGAPLEALMRAVNDPNRPAVLQEKLGGYESCAHCKAKKGNGKILKRCSGCNIPVYCSKECQKAEWSSHKAVCKATQDLAQINQGGIN